MFKYFFKGPFCSMNYCFPFWCLYPSFCIYYVTVNFYMKKGIDSCIKMKVFVKFLAFLIICYFI